MHAHDDGEQTTTLHSLDGSSADGFAADSATDVADSATGGHRLVGEVQRLQREVAVAHEKIKHLEIALQTSREIGMAIGVLMGRQRIPADRAFDQLREHSQRTHRKLRDIAADLVLTGSLDHHRNH